MRKSKPKGMECRGRRWRQHALTGALALLGVACSSSTTQPEPLEALVAVSVDGEPLPATVVDLPDFQLELLAETIRFDGASYTHRRFERFTGFVGVPEMREIGTDGFVRSEGRSMTLEPSCDGPFCVDITLVRTGDRYRATWEPLDGVSVVVEYEPVDVVPNLGG